jgi:hypothetical protein
MGYNLMEHIIFCLVIKPILFFSYSPYAGAHLYGNRYCDRLYHRIPQNFQN